MTTTSTASTAYAALSRRYAEQADLRMAQLAAWAGDVHVLEDLLWQSGLDLAPDPAAELAAVGDSVAASVEELARTLPAGTAMTARAVVEAARKAMVTTFDESVHGLLAEQLESLDQLDGCRTGGGEARASRTAARLGERSADELAAELRVAAGDCATMAGLLEAGGEPEAAARLSRQAESAAFEGYLVAAAVRAGDHTLATVDLRWDLAAGDDSRPPADSRLDRFAEAVGSAERDALLSALAPTRAP